jgi:DNA-binding winged helix-turn-helix (wHTH) protein
MCSHICPDRQIYAFDGYYIDPQRRVLLGRDGAAIRLKPKIFDTLLYLVEHAGEVVDKTTLLGAIWPNVVVEEHNLNKNVSVLRRVLGETPEDHRFIVTEPGRGYRFVAAVSAAPVGTRTAAEPDTSRRGSGVRSNALDLVAIGLVAAAVVLLITNRTSRRTPD